MLGRVVGRGWVDSLGFPSVTMACPSYRGFGKNPRCEASDEIFLPIPCRRGLWHIDHAVVRVREWNTPDDEVHWKRICSMNILDLIFLDVEEHAQDFLVFIANKMQMLYDIGMQEQVAITRVVKNLVIGIVIPGKLTYQDQ